MGLMFWSLYGSGGLKHGNVPLFREDSSIGFPPRRSPEDDPVGCFKIRPRRDLPWARPLEREGYMKTTAVKKRGGCLLCSLFMTHPIC